MKKSEFTKLTAETMPDANVLVWALRTSGEIVLAYRNAREYAYDIDNPWDNCFWRGFSFVDGVIKADELKSGYNISFCDATVIGWQYFKQPKLIKGE